MIGDLPPAPREATLHPPSMARCFVIQPFDGGPFDKRFDDILTPSIEAAGLEPYRVDRDPAAAVPIDAIESGIRDATACLADISTDNPNVWFELGYALACRRPLVLICSHERQARFPFDVQHRRIVRYKTESPSDFQELAEQVTSGLRALLAAEQEIVGLAQDALVETEGLEPHEIAALVIIARSALDPVYAPSAHALKGDLRKAGFTELACVLAVRSLQDKRFVASARATDFDGNDYLGYSLADPGLRWLRENRGRLALRRQEKTDDDLPF